MGLPRGIRRRNQSNLISTARLRTANRQQGMRVLLITSILLVGTTLTFAQSAPPVAFEVASIKVYPPNGGPLGMQVDPGRVRYTNVSLGFLITRAYGLAGDQVIGIPSEFSYPVAYEIDATFPPHNGPDQIPLMLQNLLADRFKLVVRRETRAAPVYALMVAKDGPKLKASQAETISLTAGQSGHLEEKKITDEQLAAQALPQRPALGLGEPHERRLDRDGVPRNVLQRRAHPG